MKTNQFLNICKFINCVSLPANLLQLSYGDYRMCTSTIKYFSFCCDDGAKTLKSYDKLTSLSSCFFMGAVKSKNNTATVTVKDDGFLEVEFFDK